MAPMKAMKASSKAMTKGAFTKALATKHELKTKVCSGLLESLATLATTEVKKNGVFTLPGLCRIKTRMKPATKAGIRNVFGKEVKVKAKPAKTVVKAYPVKALKTRSKEVQHECFASCLSKSLSVVGIPRSQPGRHF